jgi:membrane protein
METTAKRVRTQPVKNRLERLGKRWNWFATALRVNDRYSELKGNYVAAAVTLAAFVSLFPLLLVIIAVIGVVSSHSSDVAGSIIRNLGLTGEAAKAVTSAISTAQESKRAASIIGLAGLLWSGLGLVAAIEYALDTVWQVKGRGMRDKLGGLVWLVGAGLLFLATFAVTTALNFLPAALAPVGIVVGLALDVGLWLWTFKVLTNNDIGWKALLPGAVFGAVGLEILKAVGSIYVPRLVSSSSAMYGSLGVVFAVLAWLLLFGRLMVYAATLNVVRWEEDHGTVTVELQAPRIPGTAPVEATRAGDVLPSPDVSVPERVT